MKTRAACLITACCAFAACRERPAEITVTETRPITTRDVLPKIGATSDERFKNAKPSPVQGDTPVGWLELPPSQLRLLNYRFGQSGAGEVWVSLTAGTVLDNVNRWLGQFSAPPLDEAGLQKLRPVPIAGVTGVWVEAGGVYTGMANAPERPEYALAGIVSQLNGQILTVKMVGPKAEVEVEKSVLESFAKDLRAAE